MKNEGIRNCVGVPPDVTSDGRLTTLRQTRRSAPTKYRRAKKTLHATSIPRNSKSERFPLSQRGLGGFSSNGRIYDPVTAQFMQADNYIQTPEDYTGYNHYSYCRNNPFKFTDPSGESLKLEFDNSSSYSSPGLAALTQLQAYENALCDAFLAWYNDPSQDHRSSFFATNYGGGGGTGGGAGTASGAGSGTSGSSQSFASNISLGGKKGSEVLPTPLDPSLINPGDVITGKDGNQYRKGEDGLFYVVSDLIGSSVDNQISIPSELLNGLSWVAGTTLGIFNIIPEEPIARAICKSSIYLSVGISAIDIGIILYDAKENGFNHSTFWGIVTTAGLCGLSIAFPPIGVPVSGAYWIGDAFCQKYNNGASLVQMYTFYNYGEYPTPWLRK